MLFEFDTLKANAASVPISQGTLFLNIWFTSKATSYFPCNMQLKVFCDVDILHVDIINKKIAQ